MHIYIYIHIHIYIYIHMFIHIYIYICITLHYIALHSYIQYTSIYACGGSTAPAVSPVDCRNDQLVPCRKGHFVSWNMWIFLKVALLCPMAYSHESPLSSAFEQRLKWLLSALTRVCPREYNGTSNIISATTSRSNSGIWKWWICRISNHGPWLFNIISSKIGKMDENDG